MLVVLEEDIEGFLRDKEKLYCNLDASHLNAYKKAPGENLFFSPSLISEEMHG